MNITLKPSQLGKFLAKAFKNRLKVLIVGYPGVGKTELVRQAVQQASMDFWIGHPAISDPTDYKGMPATFKRDEMQVAEFLPFGDLRKLIDADNPMLAFLDDIGQAPFGVQAALMQLIQERRVNGHKLSEHVTFCGATNDPSMKAGVVGMIEPLKSRWDTIVNLCVDVNEWVQHAVGNNFAPEVVAFIQAFPTKLHPITLGDETEKKAYQLSTKELTNMPCPRTVESVAKWVSAGLDDAELFPAVAGAAGEGFATEFTAYRTLFHECPDPKEIIANPAKAPVPKNPSAMYAVTTALAYHASKDTAEAIIEYGMRLEKAHEVRMHQLCVRRCPSEVFWKGKLGVKWMLENAAKYLV